MNLLLFLDDWFLDRKVDVIRRFGVARCARVFESPEGAPRIPMWNAGRRCYEVVLRKGDAYTVMQSDDGRAWEKAPQPRMTVGGELPEGCEINPKAIYPFSPFDVRSAVFADRHDPDPARRFKLLMLPYVPVKGRRGGMENTGAVACSADAVNWTLDTQQRWFTILGGSDTTNNMFYNPLRKVWQAVCRKFNTDRRVAMTESPDLIRWTEPEIVLHPDALDPPLMQFYGMGAAAYEDEYFIGAVQCYRVPSEEKADEHNQKAHNAWSKWTGVVDGQLAYSYDGRHWWRSDRSPLMPRTEPGEPGSSCVYPFQWRLDGDQVLIYALGTTRHHGIESGESLLMYELRRDGFAWLEPIAGWGRFATRCISPAGKTLSLNYEAPNGEVLVQVTDLQNAPIEGYTFADCVPMQGNEIAGAVRWKSGKDLGPLAGKRIRLEFRMHDARIFALRMPCGLWYTNTPEPLDRVI